MNNAYPLVLASVARPADKPTRPARRTRRSAKLNGAIRAIEAALAAVEASDDDGDERVLEETLYAAEESLGELVDDAITRGPSARIQVAEAECRAIDTGEYVIVKLGDDAMEHVDARGLLWVRRSAIVPLGR